MGRCCVVEWDSVQESACNTSVGLCGACVVAILGFRTELSAGGFVRPGESSTDSRIMASGEFILAKGFHFLVCSMQR